VCICDQWLVRQYDDNSVGIFLAGLDGHGDTRTDAAREVTVYNKLVEKTGRCIANRYLIVSDNKQDMTWASALRGRERMLNKRSAFIRLYELR